LGVPVGAIAPMSSLALPRLEIERSGQYRFKGDMARRRADMAADEPARRILLNDAVLCDRMADYGERPFSVADIGLTHVGAQVTSA
jgi:hypothetical protein